MLQLEDIIMELLVSGGNAKAKALEAIDAAKDNDFEKAEACLAECDALFGKAHEFQTQLIQKEAVGAETAEVSLFLVHAQDHLMGAITVRDLAKKQIEMYQLFHELRRMLL